MNGSDALQSVQFVTVKGKRFAILSIEDWEAMVEWLETVEDVQVAQQAFQRLNAAGDDRKKAGWIEWEEVENSIDVLAIRKRPPYDYGDLTQLIEQLK